MISFKSIEGQDIDGNRGMVFTEYMLEPSDREEIIAQLIEHHKGIFTVYLGEDEIPIEIELKDWL